VWFDDSLVKYEWFDETVQSWFDESFATEQTGAIASASANQTLNAVRQTASASVLIKSTGSQTVVIVTQAASGTVGNSVNATAIQTLINASQVSSVNVAVSSSANQALSATSQEAGAAVGGVQINVDSATATSWYRGIVTTTNNPTRVQGRGLASFFALDVTGSSLIFRASDNQSAVDYLKVSVDGGAYYDAPRIATNTYMVFAGDDVPRSVVIYSNAAGPYFSSSASNIFTVTGAAPSISAKTIAVNAFDGITLTSMFKEPNISGAGFSPTFLPKSRDISGTIQYTASHHLYFQSATSELDILTAQRYLFVATDDGEPAYFDTGATSTNIKRVKISGLSGTHRYQVWTNSGNSGGAFLAYLYVGLTAPATAIDASRVDFYGASETAGAGATSSAHQGLNFAMSDIGAVSGQFAVSGNNLGNYASHMSSGALSNRDIDATKDFAVIQCTSNDGSLAYNSAQLANLQSCIDQTLAVYKAVIVVGTYPRLLTDGITYVRFTAACNSVQSYLASSPNPRVTYVDPEAWVGITTADGIHPNDAGNQVIRQYYAETIGPVVNTEIDGASNQSLLSVRQVVSGGVLVSGVALNTLQHSTQVATVTIAGDTNAQALQLLSVVSQATAAQVAVAGLVAQALLNINQVANGMTGNGNRVVTKPITVNVRYDAEYLVEI
jgi:hypothetical protein